MMRMENFHSNYNPLETKIGGVKLPLFLAPMPDGNDDLVFYILFI